ncbi:hypothetical protein ACIBO4_04885 [Streptomyces sp. NPDC050149]
MSSSVHAFGTGEAGRPLPAHERIHASDVRYRFVVDGSAFAGLKA